MPTKYDILGIGNAIMDVIAPVNDGFLKDNNIERNAMTLIDEDRALDLHTKMSNHTEPMEISGGSAANTLAGLAMLGVRGAYVGKVADDDVGARFAKGLHDTGLDFETKPLKGGEATARCLIAVTPDGDRSMNTFLGASVMFDEADVTKEQVSASNIIYMEGYLFDKDAAKKAFVKAAKIAKQSHRNVALTLSDLFCVDRHRDSFVDLIEAHVDILFANEAELLSLYPNHDFDACLDKLGQTDTIACVTRSEKGSVILADGTRYNIPAAPVEKVVDTTGAGDQYAAGVLAGHVMGMSWEDAGYLGSQCAAEVISHYGARPERQII